MKQIKDYEKWMPKKGEDVAVSYDGKLGRTVHGEVLSFRCFCLKVKFDEWAGDAKGVVHNFIRTSNISFGGYAPTDGVMTHLGMKGDWYSVRPWNIVKEWMK